MQPQRGMEGDQRPPQRPDPPLSAARHAVPQDPHPGRDDRACGRRCPGAGHVLLADGRQDGRQRAAGDRDPVPALPGERGGGADPDGVHRAHRGRTGRHAEPGCTALGRRPPGMGRAERLPGGAYRGLRGHPRDRRRAVRPGQAARHHAFADRAGAGGWMANALGFSITNFLYIVGYALGLGIGAYLYTRGSITIGTAFVMVYYIGMLAAPLDEIRDQAKELQQATGSVGRINELFALRPLVVETAHAELPAGALGVAFEDVSFAYDDEGRTTKDESTTRITQHASRTTHHVSRNISLTLPPTRVLGILGRTGSGKTTLTRLLFRLYDPTAGTIRLGGADLHDVGFDDLRGRVGMVTQDVQLFGASVRDNITLFDPRVTDDQISSALARLDLGEWVQALGGLDAELAAGGGGMSAGEAQLLAFTRLLLRDPGLVILDEAASRLDPITEARLERAIDRLLAGRTAIVIAHRLHTVGRADDILILEEGRVVEFGPRRQFADDPASRFHRLLQTGLEEALA